MPASITRTFALALAATAAIVEAQAPTAPIPKGPNLMTGRVLDAGTGAGVGGAIVTLTAYFDTSGRPTEVFPQGRSPETLAPRSVIATPDGDYVFRDLPAGRYTLTATAFGFGRTDYPGQIVDLTDGEKAGAVPLRLWKGNAISGRVVDEQGQPVVGIPVFALRREVVGGSLVLRREWIDALTDDRGVYRIAPLPPASYVVAVVSSTASLPVSLGNALASATSVRDQGSALRFELQRIGVTAEPGQGLRMGDLVYFQPGPAQMISPDGRVLTYATTLFPGTSSVADATVLPLGSGESRTGVDIPIRFQPTVRVSGVVRGPDGPAKQLAIQLIPPNAVDVTDIEPSGIAMAMTNDDGAFTFLAVVPGAYALKASIMSMATQTTPEVSLSASQAVTVGDTDVSGLTVMLKTGARVSGRVEFKSAAGTPPPERLFVNLRPIGARVWAGLPGQVRTDGTFTTIGVPPGRYSIESYVAPPWTWQSLSRGGRAVPDDVIQVDTDDITGLTVTFTNTPARLSGSVSGDGSARDANTQVIVFPADATGWRDGILNSRRARSVHTTSAAAFEFAALPPGEYYLVAVRRGPSEAWQAPEFLEHLLPGAVKITLREADHRTVALKTFTPKVR